MSAGRAGSGRPTHMPNTAKTPGGRPRSSATSSGRLRMPPMYTMPRPSDSAAVGAVLRGERGVDDAGEEHLEVVEALGRTLQAGGDAAQPGEVGEPHELQRRLAHVGLVAGELGQPRAALGVAHRDHAPHVEVGRARCRLCCGDDRRELGVGDRVRQVGAHRAVVEQVLDQRVEGDLGRNGFLAVAGLQAGRGLGHVCSLHGRRRYSPSASIDSGCRARRPGQPGGRFPACAGR